MSDLIHSISQKGCDKIQIIDCTEVPLTSVEQVVVKVMLNKSVLPYIITMAVSGGIITSATATDIKGNVTPIELTNNVYPFTKSDPLLILAEYFGLDVFPDGFISFDITVTVNTGNSFEAYVDDEEHFFDCNVSCCVHKLGMEAIKDCNCKEGKASLKFNKAFTMLQVMRGARDVGQLEEANNILSELQEICSGKCGC
jgi:hypothetical protein